jgi:hypothetical protein
MIKKIPSLSRIPSLKNKIKYDYNKFNELYRSVNLVQLKKIIYYICREPIFETQIIPLI